MAKETLHLTIDFFGGTHELFGRIKTRKVELDKDEVCDIRNLVFWMRDNILTERVDMFMQNNTVRPGILVMVNDTDWELLGSEDYKLEDNDTVTFISTLHGG